MKLQLGQTIRKHRNKKGYTINQLATKLDISVGLLSNIETGKTDSFQLNLLNNIVNELNIPISELKLFSKPYTIGDLSLDINNNFKRILPSIRPLVDAFITTAAALAFNEHDVYLLTQLLITELNTLETLIKTSKSS